ncbi:MAG: hypothetical protein H6863_03485 [Rhodospirillales bacterium]|nr:hypothetical protein [Rhodospirillales bacterium]
MGHAMLGQQAYSAKEYGQAKAASDKADSRSFAKDRQKERDIFLGAVQSIEDESLKIAENIAQSTNESREQWGKIEVYAGELCQKRDLLSGVRQHLLAKAECLAQFQARLAEYRADLIDDEKDSSSYDQAVARYQIYLRFLGKIREGWRELDAPERPEPMDHDREDLPALSYNEMRKMIGDDIRIITLDIQDLDDMPRLPRNRHIPNVPLFNRQQR